MALRNLSPSTEPPIIWSAWGTSPWYIVHAKSPQAQRAEVRDRLRRCSDRPRYCRGAISTLPARIPKEYAGL